MKRKESKAKYLSTSAKKRSKTPVICGIVLAVIVAGLAGAGIWFFKTTDPWERGGKQPGEYTWEEFEALTDRQKLAFSQTFEEGAFEAWMQSVKEPEAVSVRQPAPWENGGKHPNEYTLAEFEALTDEEKIAFSQSFEAGGFEAWMEQVKEPEVETTEVQKPWEDKGKQPESYTWEEFEALSDTQKIAFSQSFEAGGFEAWMEQVKAPETNTAETENLQQFTDKRPSEYTWEEFEALSDEQKIAFSQTFQGTGFEEWMSRAQQKVPAGKPWESGGKRPDEYTWAEFESLTPNQQTAFVNWFGSDAEFETWMNNVN